MKMDSVYLARIGRHGEKKPSETWPRSIDLFGSTWFTEIANGSVQIARCECDELGWAYTVMGRTVWMKIDCCGVRRLSGRRSVVWRLENLEESIATVYILRHYGQEIMSTLSPNWKLKVTKIFSNSLSFQEYWLIICYFRPILSWRFRASLSCVVLVLPVYSNDFNFIVCVLFACMHVYFLFVRFYICKHVRMSPVVFLKY